MPPHSYSKEIEMNTYEPRVKRPRARRKVALLLALMIVLATAGISGCVVPPQGTGEHGTGVASPASESSEGSGAEGGGEHGAGGESGSEGSGGSEEASGNLLTLDQTFDEVRLGARLIMAYQPADNAFVGTVENTTNSILNRVRVEIHLSNGVELGPTTPVDMAPGQVIDVVLPASGQFDGWVPHAEVGSGEGGAESGGEHGAGGESGSEGSEGSEGSGGSEEASGNLLTLDQTFDEVRLGARLIMAYQPADNAFVGTVENTTNGILNRVRVEIHLSNGVELGPTTPVDMAPGQVIDVVLPASGQFDGWVPHAEVGSGEGGAESGGEHGAGGESGSEGSGEGSEGSGGSEEASGNLLTLNQTFDEVRQGARLTMAYRPADNAFVGIVENTTNRILNRVRVEIHLSNGIELGPTRPVNIAPGQVYGVIMPASGQFNGWVPHAEVGSGEAGGESGGELSSRGESRGEHGTRGEGRSEHSSGDRG